MDFFRLEELEISRVNEADAVDNTAVLPYLPIVIPLRPAMH